jgi:beta-lactamase class A
LPARLRAGILQPAALQPERGRDMRNKIDRRAFIGTTAAAALAAPAVARAAAPDTGAIERPLQKFDALPGEIAFMLRVGAPGPPWQTGRQQDAPLFVGSAVKTFILAAYLEAVESGRLDEAAQLLVDDAVRSISSPVLANLTGTTMAKSVLEAMICHSDDTATDVALKQVGVEAVRDFIARAGLASAKIPASTRVLVSYLAGAPAGVDVGWAGMQKIMGGQNFGTPRGPMNDRETMQCSAGDFVSYYERLLAGAFLKTQKMQTEFRRISSMADALWEVVPVNTSAFGKGGSIQWEAFNAFALAGQMLLGGTVPVTFSFAINWTGDASTQAAVFAPFGGAIREALAETARAFG